MEHNANKTLDKTEKTFVQFIKFGIVGVMNTLVDFLVFQLLNLVVGWTYLAQVVGYCCGIVNSYILNSNWTFRDSKTHSHMEMLRFLLVNFASLGVSLAVLWLCREGIGITDAWVSSWLPQALSGFVKGDTVCKLIATPCAIVVNFIGNRLFVFSQKKKED